ncbi:MAG TPA: response regulator [Xanthobacteraceae bacterium]|nr:response regulator [Xanthobacteraceae bacterium]
MTLSLRRKRTICVLDDDGDVLRSLRFLLETHGFKVRTFRTGATLLRSIEPNNVDCLVIDYKMPDMDGLDVIVGIRNLRIEAPIVLITGHTTARISERAAALGVSDILYKPHFEDKLVTCIWDAMSRFPSGSNGGPPPQKYLSERP